MEKIFITYFQDSQLSQTENLLFDNPDIFSKNDCKEFREDLLNYLVTIPHKDSFQRILILQVEHTVIGIVMIEKLVDSSSYFRIKWLAIKKSEHNKGYGTKLMQYAFHEIRKLGGIYVSVETANEKHNSIAKHFYQNLGFKSVGVLPDYYPPPLYGRKRSEDSVLYFKKL